MKSHSTNYEFGALDRDGDRGRRALAPCHGFGHILGSLFDVKSIKKMKKIEPQKHPKFGHPRTRKCYQNGNQNASKIDDKRHKQSILKQVQQKIMRIEKKNMFPQSVKT